MRFSSFSKNTTALGLGVLILSACSAYEEVAEEVEVVEEPYELPAAAQANYEILNRKIDGLKELVSDSDYEQNAANVAARSDTVQMSGIFGIQVDNLLRADSITGDITTTADFGNDTVNGVFTNVFLADDDDNGAHIEGSVRPLAGTVTHTGSIFSDTIDSTATGQWTHPDGTEYSVLLRLDGSFVLVSTDGGITETISLVGDFSGNIVVNGDESGIIYDVNNHYDFDTLDDTAGEYGFYLCEGGCPLAD